jgi:hypothetical protein
MTITTAISTDVKLAQQATEGTESDQGLGKTNLPSIPHTFTEELLKKMFESADKEARAEVPDVNTVEGRKNIKDNAKKVSASNAALDTPIRDYLRVLKTQPKLLEKNARESKARFDVLKADILKPLTDAQAVQDEVIDWLNGVPFSCSKPGVTSGELKSYIETVGNYTDELVWPELKKKYKVAHESALTTATVTLERIEEAEAQAARLAELEAKQAASEQAEKNRVIAEAAAKEATRLAEAKAQIDREDVDRRAAESRQREENAKFAEQKAKQDAEQAKQDQAEAAKQHKIDIENNRIALLKLQEEAVEKARLGEVKRQADEEAQAAQAAKDREADKDNKIKINRAALADLIAAGIGEADAKTAIRAIGRREVRNISIQY